jgi:5-methylcytosine-specific restriction endonuclease McrA
LAEGDFSLVAFEQCKCGKSARVNAYSYRQLRNKKTTFICNECNLASRQLESAPEQRARAKARARAYQADIRKKRIAEKRQKGAPCRDCGALVFDIRHRHITRCEKCRILMVERAKSLRNADKKAYKARRRAKVGIEVDNKIIAYQIYDRDGWVCYYCGVATPIRLIGSNHGCEPTLDHLIPVSKGGSHTADNLRLACRDCNTLKGSMTDQQFSLWSKGSVTNHWENARRGE